MYNYWKEKALQQFATGRSGIWNPGSILYNPGFVLGRYLLVLPLLSVSMLLDDFQFLSYCLNTWALDGSWQVLSEGVYGLKVILDCLLSHPEQRDVCLLHTYTVSPSVCAYSPE